MVDSLPIPPERDDKDEDWGNLPSALPENPLETLAHHLANEYQSSQHKSDKQLLLDVLKQDEKIIHDAYKQFIRDTQEVAPLSYTAEWLLENYPIIQQAIRQVREDMPLGYYQECPS